MGAEIQKCPLSITYLSKCFKAGRFGDINLTKVFYTKIDEIGFWPQVSDIFVQWRRQDEITGGAEWETIHLYVGQGSEN